MKKNVNSIKDRIIFRKVEDDLHVLDIANLMLKGFPVCLDFTNCPIEQAQNVIHFLSGINYAIDGLIENIKTSVFLFYIKDETKDPDFKKFVESLK